MLLGKTCPQTQLGPADRSHQCTNLLLVVLCQLVLQQFQAVLHESGLRPLVVAQVPRPQIHADLQLANPVRVNWYPVFGVLAVAGKGGPQCLGVGRLELIQRFL